jgi:hypothetical protein
MDKAEQSDPTIPRRSSPRAAFWRGFWSVFGVTVPRQSRRATMPPVGFTPQEWDKARRTVLEKAVRGKDKAARPALHVDGDGPTPKP